VGDFRQKIESLIAYFGLDDAEGVRPQNVVEWCDYLKQEEKIGARTVSQKYLAAAKVVFGRAVEKRKLKTNPAADVSARFMKPKRTRPSGFTDDEAQAVLTAPSPDPKRLGGELTRTSAPIVGVRGFVLSKALASAKSCSCAPMTFFRAGRGPNRAIPPHHA
jgi:hypothetical protein